MTQENFNPEKAFENAEEQIFLDMNLHKNGLPGVSQKEKGNREKVFKHINNSDFKREYDSEPAFYEYLEILSGEIDQIESKITNHLLNNDDKERIEGIKSQIYSLNEKIAIILGLDPRDEMREETTQSVVDSLMGTKKYDLVKKLLERIERLHKSSEFFIKRDKEFEDNIRKFENFQNAFNEIKKVDSKELKLTKLN